MRLPARVKVEKEETRLTETVVLVSWRIETTLSLRRHGVGWAFAIPAAVRHTSAGDTTTRPIFDLQLIPRAIAVASSAALIGLLIARRGATR